MTHRFKMTEEDNFKYICNLTTKVLGMPDGSLALKSRKRPLQVANLAYGFLATVVPSFSSIPSLRHHVICLNFLLIKI